MTLGGWGKRRWNEFRTGHGVYLGYALSFTSFFLLVYNLLIAKVPFLAGLFSNLWVFAVVAIIVYCPLAVVIGHLHNAKVLPTDTDINNRANPVTQMMLKAVPEMQEQLKRIEDKLEAATV